MEIVYERLQRGEDRNAPYVYVHTVFCSTRCKFCKYSGIELPGKKYLVENLRRLLNEIFTTSSHLEGIEFHGAYIGGGTPSLFDAGDLEKIASSVFGSFNIIKNGLNTCEMSPETASDKKIEAVSRHGINRISFGVQSLTQEVLERVGRPFVPMKKIKHLINSAGKHSIIEINADLLAPLPGESVSSFKNSINKLAECGPDTIILYNYLTIPEPFKRLNFTPEEGMSSWPAMCGIFYEELRKNGYRKIPELSDLRNGAVMTKGPDNPLAGQKYRLCSEDPTAVLGIGRHAISTIPFRIQYQNEGPGDLEDSDSPDIYEGYYKDVFDEAFLIVGYHMRLRLPLSRERFMRHFKIDPLDMLKDKFDLLNKHGLTTVTPEFIYWNFSFRDEEQFDNFRQKLFKEINSVMSTSWLENNSRTFGLFGIGGQIP